MENWKQYFHQPKKIEDLIENAFIVVDTNVLLSAYQWRNVTVEEVLNTLEDLSNKGRLKIPFQVVKEFSKNRPNILKERLNEIESTINSLQKQKTLNERVPMLEGQEVFKKTDELVNEFNSTLKEYKNALIEVRDKVRDLFLYDPYLERLSKIIEKSFYLPEDLETNDKLKEIAVERFKEKKPPGYKDSDKEDNSEGDFIIWHTLKKLKEDVIFISNDKKKDWVYKDKHEESISARRELIEEFYVETNGKDFIHLSPKEFISKYNPNVSSDIKEDLSIVNKFKNNKKQYKVNVDILNEYIDDVIKYKQITFEQLELIHEIKYILLKNDIFGNDKISYEDLNKKYFDVSVIIFNNCINSENKKEIIQDILSREGIALNLSYFELMEMVQEIITVILNHEHSLV